MVLYKSVFIIIVTENVTAVWAAVCRVTSVVILYCSKQYASGCTDPCKSIDVLRQLG